MKQAFKKFDADGDDEISIQELKVLSFGIPNFGGILTYGI